LRHARNREDGFWVLTLCFMQTSIARDVIHPIRFYWVLFS
jgi:hypothetical protein